MFIFGFFLKGEDLRFFNWKLKKKLCQFLVSPLKTIFGCKNENVKYNYIHAEAPRFCMESLISI